MSETTGQNSEELRQLIASGVGVTGTLVEVKPFRMSTLEEILLNRNLMMAASGLQMGQFVENPWGFPVIPVPESRSTDPQRLIMAPSNITWNDDSGRGWSMIGHPIYWIDPALTTPTAEEQVDLARWAVRMFYLIMGFGLWDENLNWYDAPSSAGVNYSRPDYENYIAGHASSLDGVRYTRADLLVSEEKISRSTSKAIDRMGDVQVRTWQQYNAEQAAAFSDAQRLLKSERFKQIEARISDHSSEIARRARQNMGISDLVAPIYEAKNDLVDLLNEMERVIILLSAANYRDQVADSHEYARVLTALSTFTDRIVDGGYEAALGERVNELITLDGAMQARAFATLHEKATAYHHDAWKRLRLAAINHSRRLRGEVPFASYVEMETFEAAYPHQLDYFAGNTVEDEVDEDELTRLLGEDF